MALHESALEELGLAPLWVRRGSANAQTASEEGEGGATADVALAPDAVPAQARANSSPDAARVERAPDVAGAVRGDVRAAQQLVARKEVLWKLENEASERHIRALRERRDGGGGGDVYLRILRDLKRIHSHLAALAYLPLERAGLLQDRLVRERVTT